MSFIRMKNIFIS